MNPQYNNWQPNNLNHNLQFYHPQKETVNFTPQIYNANGLNNQLGYVQNLNPNHNNKTIMAKSSLIDPNKTTSNNASTFIKSNNEFSLQYSPNLNKYPPVNNVTTNVSSFNPIKNTHSEGITDNKKSLGMNNVKL
jgi:hypothetical protein